MDINININTKEIKESEKMLDYEPIYASNSEKEGVLCFTCNQPKFFFFNKIKDNEIFDYNNEICWECFTKKFEKINSEVFINGN